MRKVSSCAFGLVVLFLAALPARAQFPSVDSWTFAYGAGPCIDIGFELTSDPGSVAIEGTRSLTGTPDTDPEHYRADASVSGTTRRVHICKNAASTDNNLFISDDSFSTWFECPSTATLVANTGEGGDVECVEGNPPTWNPGTIALDAPVSVTRDVDLTLPSATYTSAPATCAQLNSTADNIQNLNSAEACGIYPTFTGRCVRDGTTPNWYFHEGDCTSVEMELGIDDGYKAPYAWHPLFENRTLTLVASGEDLTWALGSNGAAAVVFDGDIDVDIGPNFGMDYPNEDEVAQYSLAVTALNTGDTDYPVTVANADVTTAGDIFFNVDFVDSSGDPIGLNGRAEFAYVDSTHYEFATLNPSLPNGTFNDGDLWTTPFYKLENCTGTPPVCELHDANGLVTDGFLTPNYMLGASYDGAGSITLPSANPRMNSGGGGLVDNAFMTDRAIRVENSVDIDGRYDIDNRSGTDNVILTISAAGTADADIDVYADFEYTVLDADGDYYTCYIEEVTANTVRLEGEGGACDLSSDTPVLLAGQFGPRPIAVLRLVNNSDNTFVWDAGYLGGTWPWIGFYQASIARVLGGRVRGIWSGRSNRTIGSWVPYDGLGTMADKFGSCCRDAVNKEFSQSKLLWNIGNSRKILFDNLQLINPFGISIGATSANEVNEDVEINSSYFYNEDLIRDQRGLAPYRSQFVEFKSIERFNAEGNYMYGAYPDVTGNCGTYHFLLNQEGTTNLGTDVNIRYNYIDGGGCIAMFAVFGGGDSDDQAVYTFNRTRIMHNIATLDFYDQPPFADISVVQPTGGLIFPKMTMVSLELDRNTNQITWARDASTLFVHGGWAPYSSLDDNILQVGDTFSFSQNGGSPCPSTESTFTDCYLEDSTITGNQLIPTVTNAQQIPSGRAAVLAAAGFSSASCTTRWTGIGSSNTCLTGSTVQDRIDAAFSGTGWTSATADKGADPTSVWYETGIVDAGFRLSLSGGVPTVHFTADGAVTCLVGAGVATNYSTALMGGTAPTKFVENSAAGSRQLSFTGLAQGTNYVAACTLEKSGNLYLIAQFQY